MDLLNTEQYLEMRREAIKNDNAAISSTDYDINGFWDTKMYTDWQKKLLGGTAKYTNLNATLSGGNQSAQYLIGTTYRKESSVFPGDFVNQSGGVHFNINSASANQKFKLQFSGNYLINNNDLPGIDLTQTALELPPNAPTLYNPDGSLNWAPNAAGTTTWPNDRNPLAYTYNTFQDKTSNLIGNIILQYQLLPWLQIKSSAGYTNLYSEQLIKGSLNANAPERRPFLQRSGTYVDNNIDSWIVEPQMLISTELGDGKLDGLFGLSIQQQHGKGNQLLGLGFNSDEAIKDIASATSILRLSSTFSEYKYNAAFARLGYNWKNKYLINLTGRRDGSSRFGSANQFHNFGSLGLGWIFSEERLVKESLTFLSFGKLRGSYGTTGNDQIVDYRYLSLYNTISPGVPYQGIPGLVPDGIPNPYLQWEETRKLEFGFEFGLFKDRILGNVNYFRNRSSNQLIGYNVSIVTGVGFITTNFPATVQNYGWEFSLQSANIRNKNLNWITSFNLTVPKNKLIRFDNLANSTYSNELIIGHPITIRRLNQSMGIDPATGKYLFSNQHGSPTFTPNYPNDRTVIKDLAPKFYGGLKNTITFKGVELDFLFQFVKQIAQNYSFGFNTPGRRFLNQPSYVFDRWQKPGDIASVQRFNQNNNIFSNYSQALVSDLAFIDASFLRLKNLSISWKIPSDIINKTSFNSIRLFAQGQNLLTITNYNGLDPETKGAPSATPLPPLTFWTFGVQANL